MPNSSTPVIPGVTDLIDILAGFGYEIVSTPPAPVEAVVETVVVEAVVEAPVETEVVVMPTFTSRSAFRAHKAANKGFASGMSFNEYKALHPAPTAKAAKAAKEPKPAKQCTDCDDVFTPKVSHQVRCHECSVKNTEAFGLKIAARAAKRAEKAAAAAAAK